MSDCVTKLDISAEENCKGTYRNIMIEKEQNPKDDPKWERNANPLPIQVPKSY